MALPKNQARAALSAVLIASTATVHTRSFANETSPSAGKPVQAIPTQGTGAAAEVPTGLRLSNTVNINTLNPNLIKSIGGYKINTDSIKRLTRSQDIQASRILSAGSLARLISNQATISEAGEGILISSKLSYSLKFGACLESRQQLLQAGIKCRSSIDSQKSIEKLSNPGSDRYIADAHQRAEAIKGLEAAKARFEAIGAQTKARLQDPKTSQKISPKLRNSLMQASNAEVANEILNSGIVEISQAIYIPSASALIKGLRKTNLLEGNTIQNLLKAKPAAIPSVRNSPPQQHTSNKDAILEGDSEGNLLLAYEGDLSKLIAFKKGTSKSYRTDYFLSGFTFGKQYNWSKRISTTINPCWPFDCRETLYVEPYARFGYGLGLRFPIETKIGFEGSGNNVLVELKAQAVDGDKDQYLRAGIRQDQVFDGQELVAEIGGEAGIRYNVYVKSGNKNFSLGYDLTEKLPNPFRNGNFTPPSPDNPTAVVAPIFFEDIDLLAGYANYGVVWAKIHPGIKADLTSRNLSFTLVDNNPGGQIQTIKNGEIKSVSTSSSVASVTLKDPNYNIGFTITPGIRGKVGVDLYVWEDDWQYDVWIPELSITLPPGGVNFSCHAGTTCARRYTYTYHNGNTGNTSNTGPLNITGTWRANDGGTYLIRQSGSSISWVGRGGNFINTFSGQISGNIISGYWQDTANSKTQNSGQLTLRINSPYNISRLSHTGAFTGSNWDLQAASTPTPFPNPGGQGGGTNPSPTDAACANSSTYMGIWSFKDLATNKYARGGVTAEGRNDLVGALGTAVSNPSRAWESFRLYSIPGVAGGRRLQNTIDGRWLETVNNTGSLLLHGPVRSCNTSTKDMQWRVVPVAGQRGVYKLQNLRSNQFVRIAPGGLLKANASEAQATPFSWNKY